MSYKTENFNQLDINNSAITFIEIEFPKKVTLRIFTPTGLDYLITFPKLSGIKANISHQYGVVSFYKIFSNSDFLKKSKEKTKFGNRNDLFHYHIEYGKNSLDIASEGFVCSLIWDAQGRGFLRKNRETI